MNLSKTFLLTIILFWASTAWITKPVYGIVDTTPPTITTTNPQNNASIPSTGGINITVSATDTSGIQSLQILVDNTSKKTCNFTASCSFYWNLVGVPRGTHTISFIAKDKAVPANSSTTTITVIKQSTTPTPTATPKPTSTPNPTLAPSPTPTPQSQTFPFTITGTQSFVTKVKSDMTLMKQRSSTHYQIVAGYVTQIKEGPKNYSWGGSSVIQIDTQTTTWSSEYGGSIVLHEAVHVKNWSTSNFPVYGCDGEAKSLIIQAEYLDLVGDSGEADWVRNQIGIWC